MPTTCGCGCAGCTRTALLSGACCANIAFHILVGGSCAAAMHYCIPGSLCLSLPIGVYRRVCKIITVWNDVFCRLPTPPPRTALARITLSRRTRAARVRRLVALRITFARSRLLWHREITCGLTSCICVGSAAPWCRREKKRYFAAGRGCLRYGGGCGISAARPHRAVAQTLLMVAGKIGGASA